MKGVNENLKFNDYNYDEFDLDKEFLLGELKDGEIRDKTITPREILANHLENPYEKEMKLKLKILLINQLLENTF